MIIIQMRTMHLKVRGKYKMYLYKWMRFLQFLICVHPRIYVYYIDSRAIKIIEHESYPKGASIKPYRHILHNHKKYSITWKFTRSFWDMWSHIFQLMNWTWFMSSWAEFEPRVQTHQPSWVGLTSPGLMSQVQLIDSTHEFESWPWTRTRLVWHTINRDSRPIAKYFLPILSVCQETPQCV